MKIRKIKYFILLIIGLATFSCKKTEDLVPDKSRFYNGDDKAIATPFSLYQINTANNSTSAYTLNFYSTDVEYDIYSGSFYGHGNMSSLNLNTSIFKDGSAEQEFKIDNLREGIINVTGGSVCLNYDFAKSTGSLIKVNGGSLSVWKYKETYKLNYKLNLQNGSTVEGAFWDGMAIVYN